MQPKFRYKSSSIPKVYPMGWINGLLPHENGKWLPYEQYEMPKIRMEFQILLAKSDQNASESIKKKDYRCIEIFFARGRWYFHFKLSIVWTTKRSSSSNFKLMARKK